MGSPAVLSPRPNPPGSNVNAAKSRALAILNSNKATQSPLVAPSTSAPNDGGLDLAEQMDADIRSQYVFGKRLGEGTYAIAYQAHLRHDPSKLFAIKKMKVDANFKDGISLDPLREIKHLSELDHPNIIKLHTVFSSKDQNICLVLEYLAYGDIEGLWKNRQVTYGAADIKAWTNMICRGIWWCHENFVLHRDIKGNNLLIAADGTVKLADFGLARSFGEPGKKSMSTQVITRFYRPPELLYGCHFYNGAVDMWSVGCVIAEICLRNFFLVSETDIGQIDKICEVFGTPTDDNWSGVTTLRNYLPPKSNAAKMGKPQSWWRQTFPLLGEDGVDLLRGMVTLDPKKRLTAKQALEHRYWTAMPRPTQKEKLPKAGGGPEKVGEDLKRKGGETPAVGRADKVARKLNFASM